MMRKLSVKWLLTLALAAALAGAGFSCTQDAPPSSPNNSLNNAQGSQSNQNAAIMQPSNSSAALAPVAPGELPSLGQRDEPPPSPETSAQAPQQAGPHFNTDALGGNPSQQPAAQTPSNPTPQAVAGPDIPKDAEWTIFCTSVGGADHMHQAGLLKDRLIKLTKMKDFYLVNSDAETTLYYGFYSKIDEKTPDGDRAKADRDKLAALADAQGQHPLAACWMMQLSTADPAAPAEWNLLNVNKHLKPGEMPKYWTVEIASYRGAKERKQFAVDAVRQFREHGVQAYFYHGPTSSSVCIGAWPELAVEHDETAPDTIDPDHPVMSIDPRLPKTHQDVVTPDGEHVQMLRNNYNIKDQAIVDVMKRYPYHYLNGAPRATEQTDPRTHKTDKIFDWSFVTLIPGVKPDVVGDQLVPYNQTPWATGNNTGGPNDVNLPPPILPQTGQ